MDSPGASGQMVTLWWAGVLLVGTQAVVVQVPAYLDCTSDAQASWFPFRDALHEARKGTKGQEEFPALEFRLATEAERLVRKWHHKSPVGLDDFGPGSADFYHACHYGEESDYCLYGHVAALTYLAHYSADSRVQKTLAIQGLRLLSWGHCLDFMESSSWGLTVLDLWNLVDGPEYPHLFTTVHSMEWATRPTSPSSATTTTGANAKRIWVFEMGLHKALSHEPVNMIRDVLPNYDVVYANYLNPYEGRAEAAIHPFPRSCSPNCEHQQDSTPYIFPVFDDLPASRVGFHEVMRPMVTRPDVSQATVFLCTTPIYYCSFFHGLNGTVLGYFGLPLLYMVPREAWSDWLVDFVKLASSPGSILFANNPILAEQVAWQSAVRVKVLRPVAVHLGDLRYNPVRSHEILVPEPRDACVLHCLINSFAPSGYPFKFLGKGDTDRSFQTFAEFVGVVLYPHDLALMMFYEFYAMGLPMFLPSHMSKYIFKYSASVPLLDFVPDWVEQCQPGQSPISFIKSPHALQPCGRRPPMSPLSLTSAASLTYFSKFMDYFNMPGLVRFESIASLLQMLPRADFASMSKRMHGNHKARLAEARQIYKVVSLMALKQPPTFGPS